jgi:hypothetical protein
VGLRRTSVLRTSGAVAIRSDRQDINVIGNPFRGDRGTKLQTNLFEISSAYMKLQRSGFYRNRGVATLSSDDLTKRSKWNPPTWNPLGEVTFTVAGTDRRAKYHYDMTLTAADLMTILDSSLSKMDSISRAIGASAIAALRELLVPKQ